MIGLALQVEQSWDPWREACQLYGFESPARWQLLSVPLHPPEAARHLTQALMQMSPDRRPDTLVVNDNHLVTEVTAGLLASGIPDAELPTVIAHANFPQFPRALVPVTYLGFDSIQIIRACLEALDAQRRGTPPSSRTLIPAVFADEYAATSGVTVSVAAPRCFGRNGRVPCRVNCLSSPSSPLFLSKARPKPP
jgi:hypothetical protein